ncbi:hypothetical protein WR25_24601 [Diploscapter pachys]|uniref:Uncharacterized protein n=1 Tax=Diploscapter pachys TaxID=2018661 RepID=A0A2A2JBP5_9BILA|nr:hypothetical protein WR25_24601 [Diploscapter pachys]
MGLGGKKQREIWGHTDKIGLHPATTSREMSQRELGMGEKPGRKRDKERERSSANKGRLRVKAEAEQNKKAAGEMKRDRYMDAEAADMEIAELRDLEEGKSEKIEK